jgi:hypothetical protein
MTSGNRIKMFEELRLEEVNSNFIRYRTEWKKHKENYGIKNKKINIQKEKVNNYFKKQEDTATIERFKDVAWKVKNMKSLSVE